MNGVAGYSIGIAGSGTVARALGRALRAAGEPVDWLASRSPAHADAARTAIGGAVAALSLDRLAASATHIVIAVSDDSLPSVCRELAARGAAASVVVHTSGAQGLAPLEPLRDGGAAVAVFHPLQTLADGSAPLAGIAFGTSGDSEAIAWCGRIARAIGAHAIAVAPEQLPLYHAAAVLASNGVVGLLDAASALFTRAGLAPEIVLQTIEPLVRTTVDNVFTRGTTAALTGPVVRGDVTTVRRHMEALRGTGSGTTELYRAVSGRLIEIAARRGLEAGRRHAMQAVLDGATGER